MFRQGISVCPVQQPQVEYRDISGFSGYRIGNDGSVWSRRSRNGRGLTNTWRRKKCCPDDSGHLRVILMLDAKLHYVSAHRLVLEAFVGPCPDGMEACHNGGNPANNHISNLRWDTPRSNQADRVLHGTDSRGERNGRAKLTNIDVQAIRTAAAYGKVNKNALGRKYGVSGVLIGLILRGKNWKHITHRTVLRSPKPLPLFLLEEKRSPDSAP